MELTIDTEAREGRFVVKYTEGSGEVSLFIAESPVTPNLRNFVGRFNRQDMSLLREFLRSVDELPGVWTTR